MSHPRSKAAGHWIQLVLSVNSVCRLGISAETHRHRHLKLMVKDTRSITKSEIVLLFNLASYNPFSP